MPNKKITLCLPCKIALEAAGAYELVPEPGATEKITCDECRRRRYGKEYTVKKKEGQKCREEANPNDNT